MTSLHSERSHQARQSSRRMIPRHQEGGIESITYISSNPQRDIPDCRLGHAVQRIRHAVVAVLNEAPRAHASRNDEPQCRCTVWRSRTRPCNRDMNSSTSIRVNSFARRHSSRPIHATRATPKAPRCPSPGPTHTPGTSRSTHARRIRRRGTLPRQRQVRKTIGAKNGPVVTQK